MLRQPIVCVLGHVDHGKTSLLDAVRRTSVTKREFGGITQHVGASEVPSAIVQGICGEMLEKMRIRLTIPGLLFIDTPGHEAFTNLRKRGGSIADIAILVIDVTKGIEAQSVEAIDILREYKTPFVIAFNKIDALDGWRAEADGGGTCFLDSFAKQRQDVRDALDTRIYGLIGALYSKGFQAERFDRVSDFTKQVSIIPVSAKTREGLSDLLLFVAGLAQRFLEKRLETRESGGKGSILEIREEKGLGKQTLDVILYDGVLREGDEIVFSTLGGVVSSNAKALLKPKPLDEMRDPSKKFDYVKEVRAACGVKIACEHAEEAVAGSSLFVVTSEEEREKAFEALGSELKEILFETDEKGIILKADALGSIEAITRLLKAEGIPVHSTGIGAVSHKEIMQAQAMAGFDKYLGAIIAFNVPNSCAEIRKEAEEAGVKIIEEKIIYRLIDGYKTWKSEKQEEERRKAFSRLVLPAKLVILEGCCFRASNPCIVGVEILEGKIRKDYPLMNEEGEPVGRIKSIQHEKQEIEEAKKGEQIAVSLPEPFFGRQVCEKQVLYSSPSRDDVAEIEGKYLQALSEWEKDLLKEIKKIKGYSFF